MILSESSSIAATVLRAALGRGAATPKLLFRAANRKLATRHRHADRNEGAGGIGGYAGARVVEAGGNVNFIARGSRRLARWRFFVPWQMADRFQ
ncbi:hypothetical protein EN784_44270 [bacterium M00.F.Ca.ET.141.01.1.1]|nr:MAG: hypothetical protein EOS72_20555 [Mesorhizobium sp.]TGR21640.1 hypothetical protein EN845_23675 [Mesorhizobium sp. M8A.F.Ca.ET.202.01.1.1]TGR22072.1 hypothetical protein EN840_24885 [Mesorhizobium sp. M8A.F.Ca.ET.197.01.1.1]TGR38711.1 hypothetical protein EN842_44930 [bacterium M00.F.Ca.ET.199.01.1.1]TGR45525.1 hypothetical protein EN841_24880 [Mesorhizobium sp. M8A.F.Ca.ET.198.01.1.1]TGS37377.1 hypothetical protein EN825_31510 [Mesorhizobium sp. M8A.F.Ca.ET.182.01.1.1]TGS76003.1 hypo